MSNRRTARSNAGTDQLTTEEKRHYDTLLRKRGAMLLKHPATVRSILKSPRKLDEVLGSLIPSRDPHAEARKQWKSFYQKFFGLKVDFSKVSIPVQPEGFTRLVIVAKGTTLNDAMRACKKHFATWQYYDDLDKDVVKNDRTAQDGAYAVWFRDRIEADEEMKNLSANNLAEQKVSGITLLERILMELEYFGRTGKHLDIENWTLCGCSRCSGGYGALCYWYVVEFGVVWCSSVRSFPRLRARVAVS